MGCNSLNGEIVGECSNRSSPADKRTKDILLRPAVKHSDVQVSLGGANVEGGLGADAFYKVDLLGVNEGLVLVGVIFLSN